jgi:iron complex outermembrane recepter protein
MIRFGVGYLNVAGCGLATASVLAMGMAGLPAPAFAQTSEPVTEEDTGGLGDIIVTARKVSENLQDVPVAVTTFSGDDLKVQGATSFRDVSAFTPGFVTREAAANSSAPLLALRGQFQNDNLATLDPSVGTYVDGAYWARAYGLNGDLLDIQSVQILKGPQGTLFGRNTTGGAMVVQTNDPSTDRISGSLQATYGRFDERVGTAVLNLPLGEKAAIRGAFQINKRDGFLIDRVSGVDYNNRDNVTGRVKLLVKPTDTLKIILSGEYFSFKQNPGRILTVALPGGAGNGPAVRYPSTAAEIAANLTNVDTTTLSVAPFFPQAAGLPFTFPNTTLNFTDVKTRTFGATFALDTGFGEVKWTNNYRKVRAGSVINLAGSASPIALTSLDQNLKQYSSELQMTGKFFDDKLDLAIGAVYLHEDGFDRSFSFSNVASNPGGATVTRFFGTIENDSLGIYGQASYHLTDKLTATGGLRYSIDDKGIETRTGVLLRGNGALVSCITPNRAVALDCKDQRSDTFKAISYTVGLDYEVSDDVLIYAKQSRGFRSGGQQLRSTSTVDTAPFQPEIVNEQEIGIKAEFLDRRVRLNVAGYHNTIGNAQRSVITRIAGITQTIVENANLRNFGVEAELTVKVADGLILSASGSHNDVKYNKYIGVVGATTGVDKAALGARIDGLAKDQFTLAANYSRDISFGKLGLNVNYSWVGAYDTSAESAQTLARVGNSAAAQAAVLAATRKAPGGFVGARASLGIGENFEVAVWGRNIFDKRVFTHSLLVTDYVSSIRNDPATYGVTGTVKF